MGVPALKCDFRPACCSLPTLHQVDFIATASNTCLGVPMPFTTSRPKPPIPGPFIPKAQAPSPVEEAKMAVESPRTLGIRNMRGMIKHRAHHSQPAQPAQPFQSSPSTASPLTPTMGEPHDDVNSSFSYPASFGGSHLVPSKSFRFSFKSAMARQPSTSHHRKGYSTTTAEEYLRSVAKRDSDDGSKYGVLTDDPFRSQSRLGGGDSDYYEGAGDENGDESDYYAEDANAKYMAATNPSPAPIAQGDTGWTHNEEEVEEIGEGQQPYQDATPVHRVLDTPPTEVKVAPSDSSTHSSNKTATKRPLFMSPFSPFGRMASAGIRLRFSSIVGRSAAPAPAAERSPQPIVPQQPIEEEPLSPVSTLHSPLAASPPQIEVHLPDPELSLDHTSFPQPPPIPFRPRFLARPPGSVAGQSQPLARNRTSTAGGLQLRLQASPHLLSPSIPPSPVQPWPRENDELSSPPHSLWTVDLPNTPGTSRPTTLWVVGKLQDHLERQARTPGGDQMSDFSFDLTPPARFATLPTLETLDYDRDEAEAGSSTTTRTHTRTNSLTSICSRPPRPRRAPPPLPAVENGGRLSLISEVDSSVLDTPLPPVAHLVPSSSTASSSSATFRQQPEDKFPAPPPTEPAAESDSESSQVHSLARTVTPSPPPLPPKPHTQLKPPHSLPRRRSEDSFRAIPVREADLEEAIRLAKAREEPKQSIQVALEDPSDEDSAYGEDEFSEQESDAQVIPITYTSSPLVTPPPFQRRLPSGVSKVLRYFFS